jgi:hypothetical protein
MRSPVTIEVKPVGQEKKHAHQLLGSGITMILVGALLLMAPESLNLIIAGLIMLFGLVQLLIKKWQGPLFNQSTGWISVVIGLLIFIFPTLLNYFFIIMFIMLTVLFVIFLLRMEAHSWTWILVATALIGGVLMLSFPMAINIIFALFIMVTGLQQLLLCYQSYYRWKWFQS